MDENCSNIGSVAAQREDGVDDEGSRYAPADVADKAASVGMP